MDGRMDRERDGDTDTERNGREKIQNSAAKNPAQAKNLIQINLLSSPNTF